MEHGEFTFRNWTREKIIVRHELKDTKNEYFIVEHLESKKIQVDTESQTYEKYWVYDSADKPTGKYISSDEYKINEQVTVFKNGGKFELKFDARDVGPQNITVMLEAQSYFESPGAAFRASQNES